MTRLLPVGVALVLEDASSAPRLALRYPPPLDARALDSASELFYHNIARLLCHFWGDCQCEVVQVTD